MFKKFIITLVLSIAFSTSILSLNIQTLSAQTLEEALALPTRLLFTISGGSWAEELEVDGTATTRKGYYRLSAFRQQDNTSALFLQKIANTDQGPEEVLTLELEEVSAMNAYITDMRPESSTGSSSNAGFAAYVYLKTDPSIVEPTTYSIYVDDLDDIFIEQASN
ncbi:hypothetical protein [Lentilitoribacter sp. EG35]|jgi:hypothetical protein|uniref:hypothetical protein n=1 Tax=Lentilitoribacter sp. EG35 TaxID=3234192 RepID=UPI0034608CAE